MISVPRLEDDLVEKPGEEKGSSVDQGNCKECLRGILWERVNLPFTAYLLRSMLTI